MGEVHPTWARAVLALRLLARDPEGLGGIRVTARAGPVRERFLKAAQKILGKPHKLHPAIGDEALFGGLDLNATLAATRPVMRPGLVERPGPFVLVMAERTTPGLAARLAGQIDEGRLCPLIALDESVDEGEAMPAALDERLAFCVDLDGLALADTGPSEDTTTDGKPVDDPLAELVRIAAALGVDSARDCIMAGRAARAIAGTGGREAITHGDLRLAMELVLLPRATRIPDQESEEPEQPEPEDSETDDGDTDRMPDTLPDDLLIDAARALLPPDFLERLANAPLRGAKGTGSGGARRGNRRGRPLTPRPGRLSAEVRMDLVATLRAAAPWQKLRRRAQPDRAGVLVRPADIHLKRFEQKSDRLLVFLVDASGSSAIARLGEAKGAVEMMLSTAYARRDHVALITFRGVEAEVLLQPTRSLVHTKRQLAALPGGGGTPLASGLQAAGDMLHRARAQGMTPTLVVLTDGRANIALDGSANRAQAASDAQTCARLIAGTNVTSVVIDMGARPERDLQGLAARMAGQYLALPRANSQKISRAVSAAIGD